MNKLVLLLCVFTLVGCSTEDTIQSSSEDEIQQVAEELTEEEKQEIIEGNLELLNTYELDIKCLSDSTVKKVCHGINNKEDFDRAISKIQEIQERLLVEFEYVYESEVVGLSYSDAGRKTTISSSDALDIGKGNCKEVDGGYTSQGLEVTSCKYSSSKDKISITVKNNSGVDLRYIRVEIYGIDSNGNTVSSDYTNHGSIIRDGASQILESYVDETYSYEVEITEATPK